MNIIGPVLITLNLIGSCCSGEEEAEDEASSEEENETLCAVCSKAGKLVSCDSCPLSYHFGCAKPQLKKIPKGKWLCQICAGTDTKAGKIKMNLGKHDQSLNCLDRLQIAFI